MKKIVLALVIALAPAAVDAASFVVTPSEGSYTEGQTITLTVSIDPTGTPIYTAMLDTRISPAVFEVVSFTLDDALLPLKQPGYDALDKTTGVLTKTGGYAGGVNTMSAFGTVVLRAKQAGAGTIAVLDNSKLYDANNIDQQSGTQTYSYTVTAPAASAQPAEVENDAAVTEAEPQSRTEQPVVAASDEAADPTKASAEEQAGEDEIASTQATSTQVAAAAAAGLGIWGWVLALFAAMGAFAAGYVLGVRRLLDR